MSKPDKTDPKTGDPGDQKIQRRSPVWTKTLMIASVALMVVGIAGWALGAMRGEEPAPPTSADGTSGSSLVQGFAPSESNGESPDGAAPSDGFSQEWSPAIFRLGFSFFVGFCIAYALRAFFKISIVAFGLLFLALFGLQYAGLVNVDWNAMGAHYDSVLDWLKSQTDGFQTFVTGHLPSAGSALFGVYSGFKRR